MTSDDFPRIDEQMCHPIIEGDSTERHDLLLVARVFGNSIDKPCQGGIPLSHCQADSFIYRADQTRHVRTASWWSLPK